MAVWKGDLLELMTCWLCTSTHFDIPCDVTAVAQLHCIITALTRTEHSHIGFFSSRMNLKCTVMEKHHCGCRYLVLTTRSTPDTHSRHLKQLTRCASYCSEKNLQPFVDNIWHPFSSAKKCIEKDLLQRNQRLFHRISYKQGFFTEQCYWWPTFLICNLAFGTQLYRLQ